MSFSSFGNFAFDFAFCVIVAAFGIDADESVELYGLAVCAEHFVRGVFASMSTAVCSRIASFICEAIVRFQMRS